MRDTVVVTGLAHNQDVGGVQFPAPATNPQHSKTKARGDIAEYQVVAELLERGHNVLIPCGDRLPYDVAIDNKGRLIRIQVRRAWWEKKSGGYYCIDVRRSQTNRRIWMHSKHDPRDYDFFIAWIPDGRRDFYVIPAKAANSFGSHIMLKESGKSRAVEFRNAWNLLELAVI